MQTGMIISNEIIAISTHHRLNFEENRQINHGLDTMIGNVLGIINLRPLPRVEIERLARLKLKMGVSDCVEVTALCNLDISTLPSTNVALMTVALDNQFSVIRSFISFQILADLVARGSEVFIRGYQLINLCWAAGLVPKLEVSRLDDPQVTSSGLLVAVGRLVKVVSIEQASQNAPHVFKRKCFVR